MLVCRLARHLRWHRWMNTLPRHSNTWYRSVLCTVITLAYRLYSSWLLIRKIIHIHMENNQWRVMLRNNISWREGHIWTKKMGHVWMAVMSYFFYDYIIFCGYMICKKGKCLKQRSILKIEAQSKIQNKLFSSAIISEIFQWCHEKGRL
jgi:hypothetical protein